MMWPAGMIMLISMYHSLTWPETKAESLVSSTPGTKVWSEHGGVVGAGGKQVSSCQLFLSAVAVKVGGWQGRLWTKLEHPGRDGTETEACCVSNLSFCDRIACSGSQLL